MKRVITSSIDDSIFGMSKIVERKADLSRTGAIHDFIYFSECNDSHGPRIKFYGGTAETRTTKTAPSMSFGLNESSKVILQPWMNKQNCPRAFDKNVLKDLRNFIAKNKPILLLVWFQKLDEADALDYFHGHMNWSELLKAVTDIEHISESVSSMDELNTVCIEHNLYTF